MAVLKCFLYLILATGHVQTQVVDQIGCFGQFTELVCDLVGITLMGVVR